ncbi:ParB/RepB/Spo0J family partition protein [Crystallibacter degradans]|uniref:ParB/RepB/Spo0J family partition protein n=1 Tax=Crystallibacter degradans TaxID=2726743 RepID=UPI00147390F0|nr:ParB/RepB/Spo0J family partition protein [Arthrobacter sp. SF27]NMR28825.1 ParB/RepB/Spo0J family partition protein [Arthrobacter sp. SF27]
MSEKRRGLGRGLGALIPNSPVATEEKNIEPSPAAARRGRPVDVFFPAASRRDEDNSPFLNTQSERGGASSAAQVAEVLRGPRKNSPSARKPVKKPSVKPSSDTDSADTKTETPPDSTANGNEEPLAPVDPEAKAVTQVASPVTAVAADESEAAEQEMVESIELPADTEADENVSRETLVEVPGTTFAEVPILSIHPNRKQPRTVFDEEDMAELVHSVREIGILQPIVVRPSGESGEYKYELVMGERRWRASQEAGMETIPAIIRSTTDDDLLRDALLENLHRSQLNPLEEAAAYQQLLEDFGCTHDELADRIGRSRPQVSNMIRLMKLPPLVQRRVAAGVLSAGHARALLGLADPAEMEKLAQRIVAEGLSVRATEEMVSLSDGLRRPKKESKPRAGARHERLDYLATSLSDRLDTSVKITLGAKKGRVSIEFASVDDLNRIMTVLSPNNDG